MTGEGKETTAMQGLELLRTRLSDYTIRTEHQLADAWIVALGHDVTDNAAATLLLINTDVSRAGASNVRSAFEAGQDMLLLTGPSADATAAMAYAFELLEQEQLRGRSVVGGEALAMDLTAVGLRKAEEVIADEVVRLESEAPGLGTALDHAFRELVARKRRSNHWTGMSRKEVMVEICSRFPELSDLQGGLDALYGRLSVMSHPRLRSTDRRFTRSTDGVIALGDTRDVRESLLNLVLLSLLFAGLALDHAS